MRNDLTGKTFNRLTVISYSHKSYKNENHWLCSCICGNNHIVSTYHLTSGKIKSCGCLLIETRKNNAKHGMTNEPIYARWNAMKRRCKDKENMTYGGKGISYDESWEDFINFYNDMHEGFEENLELDRIDVEKDYSKENCRWVTHSENNYNKTKQSNNISGKTGVSFHKESRKFRAYITKDRKQIYLGLFETLEEAIEARKIAEIEVYGYGRP